jgi:hypothetical protein
MMVNIRPVGDYDLAGGVPPQSLIGVDSLYEFMLTGFMLDMSGCSPLMFDWCLRTVKILFVSYRACIYGFSVLSRYDDLFTFTAPITHVSHLAGHG